MLRKPFPAPILYALTPLLTSTGTRDNRSALSAFASLIVLALEDGGLMTKMFFLFLLADSFLSQPTSIFPFSDLLSSVLSRFLSWSSLLAHDV